MFLVNADLFTQWVKLCFMPKCIDKETVEKVPGLFGYISVPVTLVKDNNSFRYSYTQTVSFCEYDNTRPSPSHAYSDCRAEILVDEL